MMPQKDGLAVIKELRRYIDAMQDAFDFQKPTFVIATAYFSEKFEKNAILNGADYCVEKPINFAQIQRVLGL